VGLPICHCEQSWEGGKSKLMSPDTGLEHGQEMLRAAHGRVYLTPSRFIPAFPVFECSNGELWNQLRKVS